LGVGILIVIALVGGFLSMPQGAQTIAPIPTGTTDTSTAQAVSCPYLAGNSQNVDVVAIDAQQSFAAMTEAWQGHVGTNTDSPAYTGVQAGGTAYLNPKPGKDYKVLVTNGTYADTETTAGNYKKLVDGHFNCDNPQSVTVDMAGIGNVTTVNTVNSDGLTANAAATASNQAIGAGQAVTVTVNVNEVDAKSYWSNPQLASDYGQALCLNWNTTEFDDASSKLEYNGVVCPKMVSVPSFATTAGDDVCYQCKGTIGSLFDFGTATAKLTLKARTGQNPYGNTGDQNVTGHWIDSDYYWDATGMSVGAGFADELGNDVGISNTDNTFVIYTS
jgi:phosphotransferase system HPr-like phosphotransfer protein